MAKVPTTIVQHTGLVKTIGSMLIVLLVLFYLTILVIEPSIAVCRMNLNNFVVTIEEHCTKKI